MLNDGLSLVNNEIQYHYWSYDTIILSSLLDTNDKCTKGFCVKVAKCKEQNDI